MNTVRRKSMDSVRRREADRWVYGKGDRWVFGKVDGGVRVSDLFLFWCGEVWVGFGENMCAKIKKNLPLFL